MNIKHIINIGILSFLSLPIYAIEIPLKTECVGYYSLSLPENIETALYSGDDFEKNQQVLKESLQIIKRRVF